MVPDPGAASRAAGALTASPSALRARSQLRAHQPDHKQQDEPKSEESPVKSENRQEGRWVAKLWRRVTKLVAHLLATAALWVRIQT
jgi:hypothetical protein